MLRDYAYEDQCYRRRNAAVKAIRSLALRALAPKNLQAETDAAFAKRQHRAEGCVQTTSWMSGFFINVGDFDFTKAQEKLLLADIEALLKVRVTVRRATSLYKRCIEVVL